MKFAPENHQNRKAEQYVKEVQARDHVIMHEERIRADGHSGAQLQIPFEGFDQYESCSAHAPERQKPGCNAKVARPRCLNTECDEQ